MARAAASDAVADEAVALERLGRRPPAALAAGLGAGEASDKPNDAGALGQQDTQVVLALGTIADARPVVGLRGAATWGAASRVEATQAEAVGAAVAAEGVDSSSGTTS